MNACSKGRRSHIKENPCCNNIIHTSITKTLCVLPLPHPPIWESKIFVETEDYEASLIISTLSELRPQPSRFPNCTYLITHYHFIFTDNQGPSHPSRTTTKPTKYSPLFSKSLLQLEKRNRLVISGFSGALLLPHWPRQPLSCWFQATEYSLNHS